MSGVWYPNQDKKWSALDSSKPHPSFNDPTISEEAKQKNKMYQLSEEYIAIVDSADVQVTTTDTKVALSIQAALQAAITAIISISIADSEKADRIAQELFQKSAITQINRQRTIIRNSRNVSVTTTDTDIAVNIQILLQILVALLVKVNIL
ncbi:spore coat protein [Bacillus sp. AFS018417]|uniref:spore coat protein n=1 Tax=Bacillus sp. AFS018417 TaxID=2033491 RepID=UPI000BF47B61|nr:spore coat protein [Bacillus sp. AFS018417]PEZ09181.1 spore coat protein [Bacillus sp. AFS018417]